MLNTLLLASLPRLDERGRPVGQWGPEEWLTALAVLAAVTLIGGIGLWRDRQRLQRLLGPEPPIMEAFGIQRILLPRLAGAGVVMVVGASLLVKALGGPVTHYPIHTLHDLFLILTGAGLVLVGASLLAPVTVTVRRIFMTPNYLYIQMSPGEELVQWDRVRRIELVWNTRRDLQGLRLHRAPTDGVQDLLHLPGIRQLAALLGHKGAIRPVEAVFRPALKQDGATAQLLQRGLRAAGVAVESRYMLFDSESAAPSLRLLTDLAIGLATLLTGLVLGLLTVFWVQWLTSGDVPGWLGMLWWGMVVGFVYTTLLVVGGPLRGWLWKTLEFLRRPRQRFNVELGEDGLWMDPMACRVVPASLTSDDDSLLFQFDGRRLRIRRRDLLEVTIDESIGFGTMFRWRYVATPIRLRWLTEEAAEHGILLHACNRSSLTADRWSTDRLYVHLCRWRDGEPLDLAPVERVTRLRAVPALVLLLAGVAAIPALHNHLVMTRIRTGEWRPAAAAPMRKETLMRVGSPLEAVNPTSILLREEGRGYRGVARWWRLDLSSMSHRFLCYADGLVVSRPGNPTVAAAVSQRHWRDLLVAFHPPPLPAQLMMLDARSPIDAPWIPEMELRAGQDAMHAGGILLSANALPASGRQYLSSPSIFIPHSSLFEFARRTDLAPLEPRPTTRAAIEEAPVAMKLSRYAIHVHTPRGLSGEIRGEIECPGLPFPTFFPGGRHALIHWQVMDLATGTHVAVRLPEPLAAELTWYNRSSSLFADGENLGLRVCADLDGVLINEVWSITREGNVMLVAILGANEFLVSVDGSRWLLGALDEANGVALLLYDASSGIRRPLFRGSHLMNYSLVAGHDRLIEQHVGGGSIRLLDFDGRAAGLIAGDP